MGNTRHRNALAFAQSIMRRNERRKAFLDGPGAFMYSVGARKAGVLEPGSASGKMELGLVGERSRSTKLISQLRILHP